MRPGIFIICLFIPLSLAADDGPAQDPLQVHREGSVKLAEDQDELSADVQQLVIEQTMPKVIELLEEVEGIMDETTDYLAETDTGGTTIAAQTEIIEKIHAAAKKRQCEGGSGESGGAMMDMMERMMGKKPGGEGKGKGKGGKGGEGGEQAGEGSTGLSDTGNEGAAGDAGGKSEARRIPKAAGSSGTEIPEEFRKALDAYNRGTEKKLK
jgi:hypothetical protein